MDMQKYKVYIKVNANNLVTSIEGGMYPPQDLTDWVLIDEGTQDPKYTHPQGNYLLKSLEDIQRCHNYKYIDGAVQETTGEEKATELASRPKPLPTPQEDLMSMAVDTEYRVTLLELGVK